jgi:hypothetical protein
MHIAISEQRLFDFFMKKNMLRVGRLTKCFNTTNIIVKYMSKEQGPSNVESAHNESGKEVLTRILAEKIDQSKQERLNSLLAERAIWMK